MKKACNELKKVVWILKFINEKVYGIYILMRL